MRYQRSPLCIGLGIMPLQLLNLGVIVPQMLMRMFVTRTPRGEETFEDKAFRFLTVVVIQISLNLTHHR